MQKVHQINMVVRKECIELVEDYYQRFSYGMDLLSVTNPYRLPIAATFFENILERIF